MHTATRSRFVGATRGFSKNWRSLGVHADADRSLAVNMVRLCLMKGVTGAYSITVAATSRQDSVRAYVRRKRGDMRWADSWETVEMQAVVG